MVQEAYDTSLFTHPWSLVPAGLTIVLTVLAFNTIGDSLRDTISGATVRSRRQRGVKRQRGITAVVRSVQPVAVEAVSQNGGDRALLEVRDLCVEFETDAGPVRVVDDVSFDVGAGKIVGLVGESGSGKTVSSLAILRLLPSPPAQIVGGSIRFDGRDLLDMDFDELRRIRGRDIAMVFQDPLASLDPSFTVGYQLIEAIRLHEKVSRAAARDRAARLLEDVHIPDPVQRLSAYPHQLSGGMRQRVMIAMALSCHPRLLIADEPTTALDVTVQAQIVELLNELRETHDLAVLFVTHDLALISELSDEVTVMYAGQVVEHAATADLFARPLHPYTAALLAASPGIRRPRRPSSADRRPGSPGRPVPARGAGSIRAAPMPRTPVGANPSLLMGAGRDRQSRCLRVDELTCPVSGPTWRSGWAPTRWRRSDERPRHRLGVRRRDEQAVAKLVGVSCDFSVRLPGPGEGDGARRRRRGSHRRHAEGRSGSSARAARASRPWPGCCLRLISPTSGQVVLGGDDITRVKGARLRTLRRKMQLVFQDPYSSFDPLATIGSSVGEALAVHTELGSRHT